MKTEYRLAVKKYDTNYYPKRDLEHAQKGVEDSYRDFERHGRKAMDWSAWIETKETTEWEKI